jgi:hypothetical protein
MNKYSAMEETMRAFMQQFENLNLSHFTSSSLSLTKQQQQEQQQVRNTHHLTFFYIKCSKLFYYLLNNNKNGPVLCFCETWPLNLKWDCVFYTSKLSK